jgi:hypothetical protein
LQQFNLKPYNFDSAVASTYGKYVLISCRYNSNVNNRILVLDLALKSVDVVPAFANTLVAENGLLYAGDSISQNTYIIFNGWDDDGNIIEGYWEGNDELYGTDNGKRFRDVWIGGLIAPDQRFRVEIAYDGSEFEEIGEVDGRGNYVDTGKSVTVGSTMTGTEVVGGGESVSVGTFLKPIRVRSPKFRKRTWRFVPLGIGYLKIDMIKDVDIILYNAKLPKKYRNKES